jgi:uncharacterized protein (DUF1499 family)
MQLSKETWLAIAGGLVLLGGVVLLRAWPVINVVETGRTPEYPDIQPRRYQERKERVSEAARRAVEQLPRWVLGSQDSGQGVIRAEVTSRLFRFVDDVQIRIEEQDGLTVVNVRSASRVGRGDFGQNARHIRSLFDELDRQMGNPAGS